MRPPPPVDTVPLYAELHAELVTLLHDLAPEAWERPATARWRVRDVAAHLLDGDLRTLSLGRDRHPMPPPAGTFDTERGLVEWLDRINARWVEAAERLSPAVIAGLLEWTGPRVAAHVASLDPDGPALHAVSWAGETESRTWMDVGRGFTERWHHQQQIRDAAGRPGLVEARWMRPVLELSVRALPPAYRAVDTAPGTAVAFAIEGEGGGEWSLVREGGAWALYEGAAPGPACRLRMDADTAWRVLLHALPRDRAAGRVRVEGEPRLAEPFLDARAVMV